VAPAVRFARTADGLTIAYASEGTGPPLVLVRGWITHLELTAADVSIAAFLGALQQHREVVRYDGRGNGLSSRSLGGHVTLDQLVLDIEAVVDALGAPTVTLWGSSFGGPAAIAYAARHPDTVDGLVLDGTYANGGRLGTPEQRQQFVSMLELARIQPEGVFAALSFMTDPDPGSGHEARVARLRQSIDAEAVVTLYSALYEFDVDDLLGQIRVPTLVLHRRGSRSIPFDQGRELAAGIPGATFVGLEGRAHNLWEERPAEALDAIGRFLGLPLELPPRPERRTAPPAPTTDDALPMAVLFTDMVGSTELTGRIGDEDAQTILRDHNAIVRRALEATRGREVKHTGDGIMASFPTVSAALTCAARIQQQIDEHNTSDPTHPLRVKVGINAGEPLSEDDDLFGTVVQLSARVCDRAGAGEVLVTNLVREMVAGKGFAFTDRGVVELKGFAEPVRLWSLDWSD
jgi:class 3 adenylate cyclase